MQVISKLFLVAVMMMPITSFAVENEEEKCKATGYWVAAGWYKAAVCASYHAEQERLHTELKEKISKIYPKLYEAMQSASWAADAKAVGEDSIYEDRAQDPIFSTRSCEDNLNFLNQVVSKAEWQKIAYCWR